MTRRRAPLAREDRLHPGSGEVRSQCRGGTPFPGIRDHQVVRRREAHRGVSAQLLWRNRSRCLASGACRCRLRLGSGSSFSWQSPNSARIAATCEKGFWFTTRKAVRFNLGQYLSKPRPEKTRGPSQEVVGIQMGSPHAPGSPGISLAPSLGSQAEHERCFLQSCMGARLETMCQTPIKKSVTLCDRKNVRRCMPKGAPWE